MNGGHLISFLVYYSSCLVPKCCYVWVQVRRGILEGVGLSPESWQLSTRSSKYCTHSFGKAITMNGGYLISFLVYYSSHLVHHIYLGPLLYTLTNSFCEHGDHL